jgi:nucleoside-diphosphate-sugar epimerase
MKLMESQFSEPLNIGSSESITIQNLYDIACDEAGEKQVPFKFDLSAPQGVRGRSSENSLCEKILGWSPTVSIDAGLRLTYRWIEEELNSK